MENKAEVPKLSWRVGKKSPYLGGWNVNDGTRTSLVLTIDFVEYKMSEGLAEDSTFVILHFKEIDSSTNKKFKPMLLNTTNGEVIEEMTGTDKIADWNDFQIELTTKKIKAFGKMHNAIRVTRRKLGKAKLTLTKESKKWDGIVAKLSSKETTWLIVEGFYNVSPEVKAEINKLIEDGSSDN